MTPYHSGTLDGRRRMAFFEAIDGSNYPIGQIAAISKAEEVLFTNGRKGKIHRVSLLNGDEVEVNPAIISEVINGPTHTFPALPDTSIIDYDPSTPGEVHKWPVLGWAVTSLGVQPLTMNGIHGESTIPDVLLPNGRVLTYDNHWEGLEDWLEDQRAKSR